MYSVYKKLTAQDIAVIPFNAHKQYSFASSSASTNRITHFDASWSSQSIDTFSSGASGGSASRDTINTIKYSQIDHLYYKGWKRNLNNRLGEIHYLKHKRELYDKVKVISTPTGLYGSQIKPSTFYLSASNHNISGSDTPYYEIADDGYGNLFISGSNISEEYNTDIRTNILKIGPEKGFKRYDLNVIFEDFEAGVYFRRGKRRINTISNYTTPAFGDEFDDSYYFNLLNYRNVNYSKQYLREGHFPSIDFNGTTSQIKIFNDEKFHFNIGDDFTINLWVKVENNDVSDKIYLISKSTTRTVIPSPITGLANTLPLRTTGSSQTKDEPSGPQYPFEVFVKNNNTTDNSPFLYFSRSDGNGLVEVSSSFTTSSMQHVTCRYSSSQMEIFINGIGSGYSGSDNVLRFETQNNANLYIGNKGGNSNQLSGSMSQINIYDDPLTDTQILNHYSSSNNSPYIGNCFYETGIATITHPNYVDKLDLNAISWDVSALSYIQQKSITDTDVGFGTANITGVSFKPDGTRAFISQNQDPDSIIEVNFRTPWDISTMFTSSGEVVTLDISASLMEAQGTADDAIRDVDVKPDGSKMYFVGKNTDHIYQYDLDRSWILSTAAFTTSASLSSQDSVPEDIFFKPDGYKMWMVGNTNNEIFEYNLSTPWELSTLSYSGNSLDLGGSSLGTVGAPMGVSFKPDGKTFIIVESAGTDRLLEYSLETAWDITSTCTLVNTVSTIGTQDTTPLGLFVREDGIKLFIAGAQNDALLEYDLSDNNRNNFHYKFQGTHLIYENEYQCTVDEHEFTNTMNPSARKYRNSNCEDLADFTTSSLFNPYVTTIGLYSEEGDLLVVGKLGQPIRMSDETDTTFVLRWDT